MTARPSDRWAPLAVLLFWMAGAALTRRVGMWQALGGTAMVLGAAVLLLDAERLRRLGTLDRGTILYGVSVGAFMTLVTYPLFPLVAALTPRLAVDVGALYARLGAVGSGWRPVALLPIIVAEEIVWRGFVQGALQRRHGARAGVVLAAGLYAVAQIPVGSPLLVVLAFACGLVWSGLRATSAGLVAPTIAHLFWDGAVLWLAPV